MLNASMSGLCLDEEFPHLQNWTTINLDSGGCVCIGWDDELKYKKLVWQMSRLQYRCAFSAAKNVLALDVLCAESSIIIKRQSCTERETDYAKLIFSFEENQTHIVCQSNQALMPFKKKLLGIQQPNIKFLGQTVYIAAGNDFLIPILPTWNGNTLQFGIHWRSKFECSNFIGEDSYITRILPLFVHRHFVCDTQMAKWLLDVTQYQLYTTHRAHRISYHAVLPAGNIKGIQIVQWKTHANEEEERLDVVTISETPCILQKHQELLWMRFRPSLQEHPTHSFKIWSYLQQEESMMSLTLSISSDHATKFTGATRNSSIIGSWQFAASNFLVQSNMKLFLCEKRDFELRWQFATNAAIKLSIAYENINGGFILSGPDNQKTEFLIIKVLTGRVLKANSNFSTIIRNNPSIMKMAHGLDCTVSGKKASSRKRARPLQSPTPQRHIKKKKYIQSQQALLRTGSSIG